MREVLNLFGICIPHIWGAWYVWTGTGHRVALPHEPAVRHCQNCNFRQER